MKERQTERERDSTKQKMEKYTNYVYSMFAIIKQFSGDERRNI